MKRDGLLFVILFILVLFVNGCSGGSEDSASKETPNDAVTISPLAVLLNSGDVRDYNVSSLTLIQEARKEIASLKDGDALLKSMYKDEAISYSPGNRNQIFKIKGDAHAIFPILYGNGGKILAVAGTKEKSRFAAFGTPPMGEIADTQIYRLLGWLLKDDSANIASLDENKTVALSFVTSDRTLIKEWLSLNTKWNVVECTDIATLANCYDSAEMVMTGWQSDDANAQAIQDALKLTINKGTPVLYTHTWYEARNDVSSAIASLFDFELPYGGNFWANDSASWVNVEAMQDSFFTSSGYAGIDSILAHLKNNDYAMDWSKCDDSGKDANATSDCRYEEEFGQSATLIRNMITGLDENKKKIFPDVDGYRLQKLLVLIGDAFRQNVTYPMDKTQTDDNLFFRSLFADYAAYNYRTVNPAQPDMGNFSRSDFSHIIPVDKVIALTSKKNFRSTGVYALPGQTVKVTRQDGSDVVVKVFVNTLRSGATHEFQDMNNNPTRGYNRPKFLKTPYMELKSGETIEFTSAYGGPIQLSFDANDLPVEVKFSNVGEHPYWKSSADDASFTAKMNAAEYDWAEIVTTGFEVHSKLDKMRQSLEDVKWGSAQNLANATERYMSNFPHVLAGFKGPGIEAVSEIHDFASANGLEISNLDLVKHMNADQATCGYGCSGNPYDAYWAFDPIGHGDVHELGHGLERGRFKLKGWETHGITNPYSYYTKSKYNETTGEDPDCQKLPFKTVFDKLQASVNETNSTQYLSDNLWPGSWSNQVLFTIQAMMSVQELGKLENGWHLLAREHIVEREFVQAIKSEEAWQTKKSSLGFSSYALDEAKAIDNNDWMLIVASHVSELDFRDYFSMWGIAYSSKAATQVTSFGYNAVPRRYFTSAVDGNGNTSGYCKTDAYGTRLDKDWIMIDGSSSWVIK